jgi:hippurate hydrolase
VCAAHGCEAEVTVHFGYPATINSPAEAEHARRAAALVVGEDGVDTKPTPSMGAEDFSFMLKERPGCYVWLGNGAMEGGRVLHSPHYDFNDAAIPIGASYWVRLVETQLPKGTQVT